MKKNEISFLNVLFCLMVIFIHICSEPVSDLTRGSLGHVVVFTLWKLSSFVVQGFIFLSGMKLFLSKKQVSYFSYAESRFSKIYLPYILTVCVYYIYFCLKNYFGFSIGDLCTYILSGELSAQFYFVVVIMQFYLLRPLWSAAVEYVPKGALITLSLIITAVGVTLLPRLFGAFNDRVFTTYLIYWILGCIAGAGYEKFSRSIIKHRRNLVPAFLVVALAEVLLSYTSALPYYLSELLHIAYCTLAILFCMLLSKKVCDQFAKKRLFRLINASSYYIYLWHVLVIFVTNSALDLAGISSMGVRFLLRAISAYAFSILLCGAYVKIKNRNRG